MKKIQVGLALASLVLITGCANLSQTQQSRIQTGVKLAAYVGTAETLRAHPEYRKGFEVALVELKALEAGPIDVIKLLEIVNRLPVKELKSDRAQMIITAGTILLTDEIGATPLEKLNDLRPVISAIREGVERGLGQ